MVIAASSIDADADSEHARARPWRDELIALVRATSGGLLFGAPLLYTMEVWWTGGHTTPEQAAAVLAVLTVPVLALNRTAGFRVSREVRFRDAAADTVEAVVIGLITTAAVLVLLRQISIDAPLATDLGKVLYESIPFCLGIGVARHFLHGSRDETDDDDNGNGKDQSATSSGQTNELNGTLADLGATTIGALFIALTIAPTDEVPLITSAMSPAWLLLVMAVSLVTSYAIVFVAGFVRQDQRHAQQGILQHPITETIVCYLVALVVAALLLWTFQRGIEPWSDLLGRVVVLGFPAAIGGAAGRLAL